jgi:hypothetical protein
VAQLLIDPSSIISPVLPSSVLVVGLWGIVFVAAFGFDDVIEFGCYF